MNRVCCLEKHAIGVLSRRNHTGNVSEHSIRIRPFTGAAEIDASQRLRFEVWSGEGARLHAANATRIADSLDAEAFHWGAYVDDEFVASARLSIHDDLESAPDGYLFRGHPIGLPVANLNRMVVRPEFRRVGIARAIDELRIRKARECGCRTVIASPVKQDPSIARFLSYGFIFTGVDGFADWGDVPNTAAYLPLLPGPGGSIAD